MPRQISTCCTPDARSLCAFSSEPFSFPLGEGDVIKGWDIGMVGIRVGEVRKLIVPAKLGYGRRGSTTIPPDSELHFTVKCHKITPAP